MKNSLLAYLFGYCMEWFWEWSNYFGLVVLIDTQHFHKQEGASICKYKNEANTYHDTYTKSSFRMRNVAFTLNIWQTREKNIRNLHLKTTKIRLYKAMPHLRRTCELSFGNPAALNSKLTLYGRIYAKLNSNSALNWIWRDQYAIVWNPPYRMLGLITPFFTCSRD